MTSTLLESLRQQAYDRYLALSLAPENARVFLLALFALEAELQSLPDKVTTPTLGVMRVTWWRESILALKDKAAPANPILQALAAFKDKADLLADYADTFDAAFYEEDKEKRLAERAGYMAVLLQGYFPDALPVLRQLALKLNGLPADEVKGPPALMFLAAKPHGSRLNMAFSAFKASLFAR